jgi:hypothetical protein
MPVKLYHNPILASLQLGFWLLFHPSAWRQYLTTVDATLTPDFALSSLRFHHWLNLELRRLLWLIYGVTPWLVGGLTGLGLWVNGDAESWLRGGLYALVLSLIGSLLSGITLSVAFSLVAGSLAGLLIGLLIGLSPSFDHGHQLLLLAGLFAISTASSVLLTLTGKQLTRYSFRQRCFSIVTSLLVNGVVLVLSTVLIDYFASVVLAQLILTDSILAHIDARIIGLALGVGLLFGLFTPHKKWAVILTLWSGLTLTLLPKLPQHPLLNTIVGSMTNGLLFSLCFALPYLLAEYITDRWDGVIAGLLGSGGIYIAFFIVYQSGYYLLPLSLATMVIGLTQTWWRPVVFYPLAILVNMLLYRLEQQKPTRVWLPWHTAFWDEHQRLKLLGLDKHLILTAERQPTLVETALAYLSHTPQAWAVPTVQLDLYIKQLQRCTTLATLTKVHRYLPSEKLNGSLSYLNHFQQISSEVAIALTRENSYLCQQALESAIDKLAVLAKTLNLIADINDPNLPRFRLIVEEWRQVITHHLRYLAQTREIINPYITGIPLRVQSGHFFVGRRNVSVRIEQILQTSSPPLLLYGQRRIGKTSLLNHLNHLLPENYISLFVDLEGVLFAVPDHASFFYNLSRAMIASAKERCQLILPKLERSTLQADAFTVFDEWLDEVLATTSNRIILLTLDEFEALDYPFSQGCLDKHLILGMFRHIIQHRPPIRILISGSHALAAFPEWAGYLINIETIHLSYLEMHEAQQLITDPVKPFAVTYQPAAIQRILALTRGHPALIQLLCKEIVYLKNSQEVATRYLIQPHDVEAAIFPVLEHGVAIFTHWAYRLPIVETQLLHLLARQGENALMPIANLAQYYDPDQLATSLTNLVEQELLELTPTGYRFQVELIRRWFVKTPHLKS